MPQDDSQFERRFSQRSIQRLEKIATWWIVFVVVGFPIFKIGTFVAFRPEGAQYSARAEQALALWRSVSSWF